MTRHEVMFVRLTVHVYMIEARTENLIGDRAYDSDKLDAELRKHGTEMISPHRSNPRQPKTQHGRRPRRYEPRWIIERFFACFQWQRRPLGRWAYHLAHFLGLVQLAALCIMLRQF